MSKNFVDALTNESSLTYTENGQVAYDHTGSELVNLFGMIGALRNRNETDVLKLFSRAFAEDMLLATKMAFYARDVRNGGLGERDVPKTIWKFLAVNYPHIMKKNLQYVPFFGRWDDMYFFVGTSIEDDMWEIVKAQFKKDIEDMLNNKPISIMAKWLKSINTSSVVSRKLGIRTAQKLGLSLGNYRKTLSKMRKYIDVVEKKMSAGEWDEIDYASIPSYSMRNYRDAFRKHDYDRFIQYLQDVKSGKKKINAGVLYPYDIVKKYIRGYREMGEVDAVLEEQWKNLPNYIKDNSKSVLVMCDTSGSMYTGNLMPISVALSLSVYFAERTQGEFHDKFLTFSYEPKLQSLCGRTLQKRIQNLSDAHWMSNTNLEKAFQLVLKTAIEHNLSDSDLPTSIVIISDMQIDMCANTTFYSYMKDEFASKGYTIPKLVFWNVNSRQNTFHVKSDDENVILVSGASTSTFQKVLNTTVDNPYNFMVETLSNPVYDCITV